MRNIFELPEPFRLMNVMKTDKDYMMDFHEHDFFHLNIITSGSLDVITPTDTITVPSGYLYITPPFISHKLYSKNGYEQIGTDVKIIEDKYTVADILSRITGDKCIKFPLNDTNITNYISKTTMTDPTPFTGIKCANKITSVILKLMDNDITSNNFRNDFIKAASEISFDYSLDKLCEKMRYSKTHLELLVKKEFDCTVIEYMERIRYMNVCNMLASTDMPLYEIAEKCGFYDSAHLSVFFKKRSGVSPIKYRKDFR